MLTQGDVVELDLGSRGERRVSQAERGSSRSVDDVECEAEDPVQLRPGRLVEAADRPGIEAISAMMMMLSQLMTAFSGVDGRDPGPRAGGVHRNLI
ncbi:MAG: hypothetical protein ACLFRT_13630 [Actinomycetota bacterium]